ncbi:hypothetical protein FOQG_14208 [Fusarium oxysporum f. sp. raphani 54005]|uniref:ABM domain-containing protein n=1 Tax=Fusarium oxysporum f. sp. raphani 54005 TaxID=1089458 RepID=X0CFF9_FUSOX|nr:hypothetical protein FOQG_14208 [Fusarium oxysporum f. sp. raphani 54005]
MPTNQALQLLVIPHRPAANAEIDRDLAPAISIVKKASGLKSFWRGRKFEDRYTKVFLALWDNLESSHCFFTSSEYGKFHSVIQPALNGRKVTWTSHALMDHSPLSDHQHLSNTLKSPAVEVALTKVVEGGVSGYYSQFNKVVTRVLDEEDGCKGFFISPLIENPEDQLLLINWDSVDAHHEVFEKRPEFRECIDALKDYYKEFVVPWHIVDIQEENLSAIDCPVLLKN